MRGSLWAWIRWWLWGRPRFGTWRRGGWMLELKYLPREWNFGGGIRIGVICQALFLRIGPVWLDVGHWR